MVLGQTYDEQLFKSDMFRLFINTFADSQNGIINNYKQSCNLSNTQSTITISDGAFLLQGGLIQVQGNETLTVDLNNTCCILAFEIDLTKENTETEFNQGNFKVIKGTGSTYPTLQQDDIANNSTGIYQMEFARFIAETGGISNFVDKRVFIDFPTMFENINTQVSELIAELETKIEQAENIPVQEISDSGVRGEATGTTIIRKQGKIVTIHISIFVPKSNNSTIGGTLLGFLSGVPKEYRPKYSINFERYFKNNAGTVEYSCYFGLGSDGYFSSGNLRNYKTSDTTISFDASYIVD